jgi:hypothetical protein
MDVFENRMLRKISGPKERGVRGQWRELNHEHDLNLDPSSNIVRLHNKERGEMGRTCNTHGVDPYTFFSENLKRRCQLRGPRRKWRTIMKWMLKK